MSTISQLRPRPTSVEPALSPKSVLARLDRIDAWSMPFLFLGIIGTGFLFAFYDVFDINVSFIQTCVALKHGCTPENAITTLRVPVVLNLLGYVIGALILAQVVVTPESGREVPPAGPVALRRPGRVDADVLGDPVLADRLA